MIKIYGSHQSSSRRCYWCLEEAGVKYEAVPVNFREKEHKSEAFLKVNPNGKVPALTDGDLVVWESMGINFYIGDAYKQDLIGHTTKERAPIRQWSFWALSELQPPLVDALIQLKFVPEDKRDQARIDSAIEKTKPLLKTLEEALSKASYLVSNRFTLADLNVASVVEINKMIDNDISEYPSVMSWLETCHSRPAYKKLIEMDNN